MRIKKDQSNRSPEQPGSQETEVEITSSIRMDEVVEEFLLRTRRVLVVGEINELSSIHICCQLQLLSMRKEPIYMYINSPGGCLSAGYAVIDQMLLCDCPIYTIVRGQAYSMGAMIAVFGKKGYRYITRNSSMMLHSVMIQTTPESLERHTEMLRHLQIDYQNKIAALAKRSKLTTKQLKEVMAKTTWMSPKEAMRIGVVDKIWTLGMEKAVNRSFS